MAQFAAYDDVQVGRYRRDVKGGYAWRTEFLNPAKGDSANPHAFLAERSPSNVIRPHYHDVDQFQVIVSGGGALGRHELSIHSVHFARANTPYGPLAATQEGLGFLTLRPHRAGGQWFVPDSNEELKRIPNRKPWQVTEHPRFEPAGEAAVHTFEKVRDENGLAAFSLTLAPNARLLAPDHTQSNGQYLIVTKGALIVDGKEHKSISIGFVKPNESRFQLQAGAEGAEVLALNFPKAVSDIKVLDAGHPKDLRVWQCRLCAFVYDEAQGMPEEGIAPGTRWEDVPEDWTCPDCSITKAEFDMVAFN